MHEDENNTNIMDENDAEMNEDEGIEVVQTDSYSVSGLATF